MLLVRAVRDEVLGCAFGRAPSAVELGRSVLTQLQSSWLLFSSVLSRCYCFHLLLKNYSLIIFQSVCFFIFFYFQPYNKRIKYLKSLAYYFIKCICSRMGVVTVWLSCSIESSNCLVLNSLYLKYAAYFFFIILCEYGVH